MQRILAIDVGNGLIKAAICSAAGQPELIRSDRGSTWWPSYVYRDPAGKIILGEDACEQRLVTPEHVAVGWKFLLGDSQKAFFGGSTTGLEVAAAAIDVVVASAERQIGEKIDGLVLTCPANFKDAARQALIDAAAKGSRKVERLVTEPAAAAYGYVVRKKAGQGRVSLVACIDVGHGTTDVSVLEVKNGQATPISTEGVPQLGGRDFTRKVIDLLLAKASREVGKTIAFDKLPPDQAAEVESKAERAKHALGTQASTKVALNFGGRARLIEVTQAEYESATQALVKEVLACADRALKACGKTWTDMEVMVLAGAPMTSPRLQSMMADHTGLVPKVELDPATVVVQGAALEGHNLARAAGGLFTLPDRPLLVEATAHDLGIAVVDEASPTRMLVNSVVVPKNTPVPDNSRVELFRLERDNQTDALIKILQGPNGAPEGQCLCIGTFTLSHLTPEAIRSKRIEVRFSIDANAIVTVTARDLISGVTQTVNVKTTLSSGGRAAA